MKVDSSDSTTANVRIQRKVERYWSCIEWDPGSFLTLHDGRRPRLFHQELTTSLPASVTRALTQFGRVVFRAARLVVRAAIRRRPLPSSPQRPFAVIACVGTDKYRYEEEALADAFVLQGLVPVLFAPQEGKVRASGHNSIAPEEQLRWVDIARASLDFVRGVLSAAPCLLSAGDPLRRALAVESISSIFPYCVHRRFFDLFVRDFGLPQFVISLMPAGLMSRCLISSMRRHGIPTAGIRSQTTSQSLEHLAINTEILFCKSKFEEEKYVGLYCSFQWDGPRLERGCVLSLPVPSTDGGFSRSKLSVDLPADFVLVFGTAPSCQTGGQDDLKEHHRKLLRMAKRFAMPVVYKPHPLDRMNDIKALANEAGLDALVPYDPGMGSNHELILKSSLVLSDVTTLLYGCIVARKPVVIVESSTTAQVEDEFRRSPIPRMLWGDDLTKATLSISEACDTCDPVARWFDAEYFLSEDADTVVSRLKDMATERRATSEFEAAGEADSIRSPRTDE